MPKPNSTWRCQNPTQNEGAKTRLEMKMPKSNIRGTISLVAYTRLTKEKLTLVKELV